MARLFITAKQSVARAIGSALAGKAREPEKYDDHFRITRTNGQVDRVTWCGGHLLEIPPPEFYDARYRKWRLEDLPIIPGTWRWVEVDAHKHPDLSRQLAFIRQCLKQVSVVIHAGDPDREGQWFIDEILSYCQYEGVVQRLLLPGLNWHLLRSALKSFEENPPDNQCFAALSISARARSRIDWLYGMNMTRAYTLLGKHAGYEDVLSVGRVQTPLLGMVVKRDEDIETFVPHNTYSLEAKFRKDGQYCHAMLRIDETLSTYINSEETIEELARGLRGKPATVTRREQQHHFVGPPLLLDLATLQIACSETFGYSGVDVIKIAKRLYEDLHLVSYPLTDCRYAPEKFRDEAGLVLEAIAENISDPEKILKPLLQQADVWRRSSVWDNTKLTQHYAIIPTNHKLDEKNLSEKEKNIYELIVRYYSAQFFHDYESMEDELSFCINGYYFDIQKKSVFESGWKAILSEEKNVKIFPLNLPEWYVGDDLICENIEIKRQKSTPLPRFTEASLIASMKNAGIGTEVTRAYMIDTLFRRGYLIKGNKSIYSSGIGRDLIRALPKEAVSVEMTALWDEELSRIEGMLAEEARKSAEILMQEVENKIRFFVEDAQKKKNIAVHSPEEILGIEQKPKHICPRCHSVMQLRTGRYGTFWGCSAYPACEYTTRAD